MGQTGGEETFANAAPAAGSRRLQSFPETASDDQAICYELLLSGSALPARTRDLWLARQADFRGMC